MSLLSTLRDFIDPEQRGTEKTELRVEQRRPKRSADGDSPPEERYACRTCGYQSTEGAYCPDCLADTMVPVKDKAPVGR